MDHEIQLIAEQYQLILEKDHRPKMQKFGIPQDVADYLHSFNDKYSLWFADKIKNMEGYQRAVNKVAWIRGSLSQHMTSIVDWVTNVPNIFLKQYSWEQALQASQEYHNKLQTQSLEGNEKNTIIKKYDDGFYWVDLESSNCSEEGSLMGHCGSTSADTIFSLRKYDPHTQTIEGFVSIAISPDDGVWQQAKGKKNSKPKAVYHKYIVDILVTYNVFEYQSEYSSHSDFGVLDFKNWLEAHPNVYKNTDEIIEKLEESGLQAKAEKLFANYEFEKFDVYWEVHDDGEMEFLDASANGGLDIDVTDIEDIGDVDDHMDKFLEIVKEIFYGNGIYVHDDHYDHYEGEWYRFYEKDGKKLMSISIMLDIRDEYSHGDALSMFEEFLDTVKKVEDNNLNEEEIGNEIISKLKAARILDSNYVKFLDEIDDELDDLSFFKYDENEDENEVNFYGKIKLSKISEKYINTDPQLKQIYSVTKERDKGIQLGLTSKHESPIVRYWSNRNHPFSYLVKWFKKYAPNVDTIIFKFDINANIMKLVFLKKLSFEEEDDRDYYEQEWNKIKNLDKVLTQVEKVLPRFFKDVIYPQFDNRVAIKKEDLSYVSYVDDPEGKRARGLTANVIIKHKKYGDLETGYWSKSNTNTLENYVNKLMYDVLKDTVIYQSNPAIDSAIKNHMDENEPIPDDPRQMKLELESKKIRFKTIFYS